MKKFLIILILGISTAVGISLAEEFKGPFDTPDKYNVDGPINMSDAPQTKAGGLGVSNLAIGGDILLKGSRNPGGSMVGIGTTSPSKKLDVAGDINFTGDLYKNGTLFKGGKFVDGTNTNDAVYNDGNVGIGTTSPTYKLDVNGQIKGTYIRSSNGKGDPSGFFKYSNGTTYIGAGKDENGNRQNLTLYTYGGGNLAGLNVYADKSYFNGNVGIGTTSPGHALTVKPNTNSDVIQWQDSSGKRVGMLGVAGASDKRSGWIGLYDGDGNYDIRISPDGDTFFNGGNVGIGTTSPARKLEITNGPVRINGSGKYFDIGPQNSSWVHFYTDVSQGYYFNQKVTVDTGLVSSYDEPLQLQTSGSTKMFINTNGNVGIGTTSPSAKLEVAGWYGRTAHNNGGLVGSYNNVGGNGAKTNPIYVIGSNYKPNESDLNNMYGIGYAYNNNASYLSGLRSSGNGWGLYAAADGDARIFLNASTGDIDVADDIYLNDDLRFKATKAWFIVDGKTRMFIQDNGNVGIGTTSPGAQLEIKGDGRIRLEDDNTDHHWDINLGNSDSYNYLYFSPSTGDGVYFRDDGSIVAKSYEYSDKRLKKNIKKLENYRDILKIDAVRFNWKKDGKADIGIIAQEVQKYFPEFVSGGKDDILTVDYAKIAVPMLNLLQEQEDRLDKQEKEIQELKEIILEIKNKK